MTMEKVWFNPLNYWLIFTGLLVILDLILRRGMHVVLVGVGCFIAAFLASLGLGLTAQIAAFVLVSLLLVLFYHETLMRKRKTTLEGISKTLDWINAKNVTVVETIRGPWRAGKIAIEGVVVPAVARRTIPEGTTVDVLDCATGGYVVTLRKSDH